MIYDLTFEPNLPVPMISSSVPIWPREARQAEVLFFCKRRHTAPDVVAKVGRHRDQPPKTIFSDLQATYQVSVKLGSPGDPLRVVVTERYPASGATLYVLKTEMYPQADLVQHRFDTENSLIEHVFFYERANPTAVDDYEVRFTTRKSLISGAVAPEPTVIEVPDPNRVFQ